MTINNRIEQVKVQYFGNSRGSHKKFIEKLNVASNTASNWMKDGYNVGKTVTDRILDAFPEISAGWLLTGEGEMLKSDKPKYNEAKMIDPNFTEVIKIPVKAKAGYLDGYNDEIFLKEMPIVLVQVDQTFHGKYRCFDVEGDSMNDGTLKSICDGDTVLCREVKKDLWHYKLHYNQWMFVINHVDGLLIKQIVDHDVEKGTITCHSLNPIYGEDFILNLNEVRELYNVIKITDRNLKL